MSSPSLPDAPLLVAVNHAVVYGSVGRWLVHDLRNPVQALALVTELFGDDPASALDRTLQTTLGDSVVHLTRALELQDRVLRLPTTSVEVEPVALGSLFEFFAGLHTARRTGVALALDAGGRSLPAVAAHEGMLEHALLNLVVNAYEALSERGENKIAITAELANGWVEVSVSDDGPGLPTAVAARAFEPYVTSKKSGAFSGLGLPVARHLVESFGGTLELDPARRQGTRMVVRLRPWPRP